MIQTAEVTHLHVEAIWRARFATFAFLAVIARYRARPSAQRGVVFVIASSACLPRRIQCCIAVVDPCDGGGTASAPTPGPRRRAVAQEPRGEMRRVVSRYQAGGPLTARGMGGRLSDRGGELQEQRRRTSLALFVSQEIYSEMIPPEPRVQPIRTSKTGMLQRPVFSPPRRGTVPHTGACVLAPCNNPSPEKPASQRG